MTVLALFQEHQEFHNEQKMIIKPLPMRTLTGILANVKYHKLVIALTFIVIHGKLILHSLQVLLRLLLKLDSSEVLVKAHLPQIHWNNSCLSFPTTIGMALK